MINFDASNLIIMWYPQYAGGKFIMNCLSLSRYAVPMNTEICNYLLNHPDDYNYRLNAFLKTIPPKHDMRRWLSYEFNNASFYNDTTKTHSSEFDLFKRMHNGSIRSTGIDLLISQLIDKNVDFFAETRGNNIQHLTQYLELWPNAKIIMLTNFANFQQISQSKKRNDGKSFSTAHYCGNECKEKYESLKGEDWPTWEMFEKCNYNIDKVVNYVTIKNQVRDEIKTFYPWHCLSSTNIFNLNVDNTFFDEDRFVKQIKLLYNWLGYDDFNETLLLKYYRPYIDIHKD